MSTKKTRRASKASSHTRADQPAFVRLARQLEDKSLDLNSQQVVLHALRSQLDARSRAVHARSPRAPLRQQSAMIRAATALGASAAAGLVTAAALPAAAILVPMGAAAIAGLFVAYLGSPGSGRVAAEPTSRSHGPRRARA